jgi:short-subunit dehydrogenase
MLKFSGKTALVTGATAGLGAEFARQLAASGTNLVLVARDMDKLDDSAARLRSEYGIAVEVLSADLETESGAQAVAHRLRSGTPAVDLLINNAGYGLRGRFDRNSPQQELDHLRILVTSPMELMHAALGPMLQRGSGVILNVASVAGFVPRGTYGACKAWLISFSRWANVEYGPEGVSVTAVCPGFVNTEFHQRMGVSKKTIPGWLWLQPERVVREGLAAAAAGRAVSVPSRRYTVAAFVSRFLPARLGAYAGKRGR